MRIARVGDIAEQVRGVTYAKSEAVGRPAAGLVPLLRAGNITDHGVDFDDLIYVPASRVSVRQSLQGGDVLIAASSGSLDVVGKAARLAKTIDATFGAFCKVLRPSDQVDSRYFAHYFRTPRYRREISSLASGANINNLRNEHLDDLRMPLPPLEEQRRIAEILDRADALRAKRREALALLGDLTQSIFLDMFGDPVTNPRRWPVLSLGERLVLQQYGPRFHNEQYAEHGIRIVRITDLDYSGSLDFDAMPRLEVDAADRTKFALKSGDVIFARTGATVGKVALIGPADPPSIAGAYFIRMHFGEDVLPAYAAALLRTKSVQAIIWAGSHQSAQQNFSGPGLRALPLLLPPVDLQQRFADAVAAVRSRIQQQSQALTSIDGLFASLQQRAFAGLL